MAVEPYLVAVPESQLQALNARLSTSIFPDELDEAGWSRGAPLRDLRRLATYWKDRFDWRAVEARINELPHFTTPISADGFESIRVHFVHKKSDSANAIPLLFCHGWPGSFLEVSKLLPLLTSGDGEQSVCFHVVAPSIPNFGFSEGTKNKGFGLAQYAETCHKLMLRLGYPEYVTQGGDWGTMITRVMGLLYPSHVKASHINLLRTSPPAFQKHPLLALQNSLTPYSARDKTGFARAAWFAEEGSGYRMVQSTKPQTLGYALADSPVGLLAWIYEKLHDWTHDYPWTDDEILTWVSVYWFSTAGPAASLRIYYEASHDPGLKAIFINRTRTHAHVAKVPLGLAHFPKELSVIPHIWAKQLGNVVYQSENKHGGHFAATEHPEVIAKDLNAMFGRGGPAYGVVSGRNGHPSLKSKL